ncbi:MAG: DUF1232 domain-containing protein [Labilithrix sp.]|nr:DUF1232 domain-containing protein [Labilithrix sp.]MCW5811754.1 DUF1232 domain-containing protein [Labilithrix sp.]
MTSQDPAALARYLDVFPEWLRTLGEDAAALGQIAHATGENETGRYVIAGLNYVFKSLDLIADGIDDVGFCDDAFVIRVAAALAVEADPTVDTGVLGRLAADAKQVEEFLEEDYPKLVEYVKGLKRGAARGRTVDDIIGDSGVRALFVQEVGAWAQEYKVPSFSRDVKTLIKLKAFLGAKLS